MKWNIHVLDGRRSKSKGKVTIEQALQAQRRSRSVVILFNLGARLGWVVNSMAQLLYSWERDAVPIVSEAE